MDPKSPLGRLPRRAARFLPPAALILAADLAVAAPLKALAWERRAWPLHVVDRELNGIHGLCAGDVDHDGRPDVISSSITGPFFPNSIAWFQLSRRGPEARHIVTKSGADGRPHYLDFADMNGDGRGDILLGDFDGDGDVDVAVASYTAFVVRWYENDGRGYFTAHDIDTGNRQQAYDLKSADVDGDGRPDLILAGRESRNAVLYCNRR